MTLMCQWWMLDQLNVLEETKPSARQPAPRYIQPGPGKTIYEFLGLIERGHVVCGLRLKTYTIWFLLPNSCTNDFSWKTKQVVHTWFLFLSLEYWQKQWEMEPPAAVGYLKNTWPVPVSMLREMAELIPCRVDLDCGPTWGSAQNPAQVWKLCCPPCHLCGRWCEFRRSCILHFETRTWEWRRSLPSWSLAAVESGVRAVAGGENAGSLAIYQRKLPEALGLEEGEGRG